MLILIFVEKFVQRIFTSGLPNCKGSRRKLYSTDGLKLDSGINNKARISFLAVSSDEIFARLADYMKISG